MIAETLLLLNDDPSKPLNEHFNDSLTDLTNRILNAIQYVETDNVLKILFNDPSYFAEPVTFKHSGTLKIKVGPRTSSGPMQSANIYINDVMIERLAPGDSTIITVNAGDVLRMEFVGGGPNPDYVHLCGFPTLIDF